MALGLEPLPESAIRELLTELVPGLPDAPLRAIAERADGIPLYAVETIRMLVAEGRLAPADGGYVPSGDLTNLSVPETLHALIAARLDALPPPERSLIQDAAVLGQSFTVDGLAAVSGQDRAQVEELCRALTKRELLVQNVDPRSAERGQVAFVQALIREVAYGTLSRRDRRSRHLAAARFFESLGEDELAGALASHYLAAYRAAPDDPDSRPLAAQAKIALRAAASRASSLGSHDQAVRFLVEAIEVTDDPAEIAELLERAGEAAVHGGDMDQAEPLLRDAIARREELGDRSGAARATALLGQGLVNGWRSADAIRHPRTGRRRVWRPRRRPRACGDRAPARAGVLVRRRHGRAIEFADRAIGRAERIEAVELIADCLITKGALLGFRTRPYEGTGILEAGIRLAETLGLRQTVVRGLLNLGVALLGRDPRGSFERSKAAFDLARRFGFRNSLRDRTRQRRRGRAWTSASGTGPWRPRTSPTSSSWLRRTVQASCAVARRSWPLEARRSMTCSPSTSAWCSIARTASRSPTCLAGRAAAAFAAGRYREAAAGLAPVGRAQLHEYGDGPPARRACLALGG